MTSTFNRDGHEVELSSLDKVFFPEGEITKGDVISYFERVAPYMLPYLKDRPLMMQRFPDGIQGEAFYQKSVPDYFPDWIDTVVVDKRGSEEQQELVVCNNTETLLYLANQGCLTFHPWLSRVDRLDQPDRAVIDLDPPDTDDGSKVRQAARLVSQALLKEGQKVFVTTTGSSGYHLVIPLRRDRTFDEVRDDLKEWAEGLEKLHPDLLTTQHRKAKRGDKIYLDIARNAYAQTSVSIYSVRGLPGAPVATPLDLEELDRADLRPRSYGIKNIFRRLAQKEDPWREFWGK